jgi:uncharacterized protein (TIGR00255 family)
MICSMTGFARAQSTPPNAEAPIPADGPRPPAWTWELRSVNGKGLDVRLRLPSGYEALEIPARDLVAKHLARGNVSATLQVRASDSSDGDLLINWPFLHKLMDLGKDLPAHVAPPTLDGLLTVRGVLVAADDQPLSPEARTTHHADVLAGLVQAVSALAAARQDEGNRLDEVLRGHLSTITALTDEAESCAALRPDAVRDRLRRQISEILEGASLPEDRILQEVALIATRLDVREELDRLRAHISQARDLLAGGGACGRRLDFLCQEFNREANTLCSKSQDTELTRIGLSLKAVIDQFREQVQIVE